MGASCYYPLCLANAISKVDHSNAKYQFYVNKCTRYGLSSYLIYQFIFLFLLHFYTSDANLITFLLEYLQLFIICGVWVYRRYKGSSYFFNYYDWGAPNTRIENKMASVIRQSTKDKEKKSSE